MESIKKFKSKKILEKDMSMVYAGSQCVETTETEEGCGDTIRVLYNEDGSFCCIEKHRYDCCV